MDNLITGDVENIEHLFTQPAFHFEQRDVTEYIHVGRQAGRDPALRLAGLARSTTSSCRSRRSRSARWARTRRSAWRSAKGARFLLASTSEVYGDPLVHPQPESYWGNVNPVGPRGVYDEAKRFAEAMTMAYHRFHGVDTRIVRIFNTYGPRMRLRDGRVLPAFMTQALRGEPLTVFGDGSQTRSLLLRRRPGRGHLAAARSSSEDEPVNIGNPREMTILQFAQAVIAATGADSRDRVQGAAGRRPARSASPTSRKRAHAARLGAAGRPRGRPRRARWPTSVGARARHSRGGT